MSVGSTYRLTNIYLDLSQASRTTMDSNKSTAQFEIPRLSFEHAGLWECRVSTNGGQDSRKFNLTVKGQKRKVFYWSRSVSVRCLTSRAAFLDTEEP